MVRSRYRGGAGLLAAVVTVLACGPVHAQDPGAPISGADPMMTGGPGPADIGYTVDLTRTSDHLMDVTVHEVLLHPGEALFIPVGWWHQVLAVDTSISLAFTNFIRRNRFDWYTPGVYR